jgi:hypothetical protein
MLLLCNSNPALHDDLPDDLQLDLVYVVHVHGVSPPVCPLRNSDLRLHRRLSLDRSSEGDRLPRLSILALINRRPCHLLPSFFVLLLSKLAIVSIDERLDHAGWLRYEGSHG